MRKEAGWVCGSSSSKYLLQAILFNILPSQHPKVWIYTLDFFVGIYIALFGSERNVTKGDSKKQSQDLIQQREHEMTWTNLRLL